MKKIYLCMMAALAVLASCDPSKDDKGWSGQTISADQLEKGIVLEQFDYNEETGQFTPSETGNFIKYSTNPSKVVEVYYLVDGEEMGLASGAANGIFPLFPTRGSDPNQTVYFRTREFDGSSVTASKQVTVKVATELSLEMSIICSNAGEKVWTWAKDGREVWGNFGYTPGAGEGFAENLDGKWWGVDFVNNTFADQQQHRGGDTVTGDDQPDSYMVISERGTITCYDPSGKEIRSAKFQINDFDPVVRKVKNDQPWHLGKLVVKGGGGVLWPYAINTGGYQPEEYEIMRLSATQLILTYAAEGTASWSEATFWRFESSSDKDGVIAGYTKEGVNWTWDTTFGEFWGNGGYHGGDAWSVETPGKWWGITSTEGFADQQQHRGGDKVTGDDNVDAYMTFTPDGNIKSFDATGKEIRSGKWSTGLAEINGQSRSTLNTTAGSILWPYAINTGGYQPERFELVWMNANQMALVYAADGTADWSEATFWRFKKK